MDRWLIFIRERFSLTAHAILAGGIASSGMFLNGGQFDFNPLLTSFCGLMLFFFQMRLMDEEKDYEKDKIAHPERPMPSDLISREEMSKLIYSMQITMLLFSAIVWINVQAIACMAYAMLTGYAWLIYKEFYLEEWLKRRPLIQAISHQLILVPVTLFAVSINWPKHPLPIQIVSFCLILIGAFFCHDICRKLNPFAHPVLMTYIHFYGYDKTFFLAVLALLLSAIGAMGLGLESILWALESLVLLSLLLLFLQPQSYRLPEMAAYLSLVFHTWAGVIQKIESLLT